ncbi:MAG: DNA polymerase III subunit beta [Clostridiales bacterium]|nr:DNA polymerase III subunit beta [Clostridiales bacterium]
MKIVCEKEKLLKGLNCVQRATSSKSTMPILFGILIQTNDNQLRLTTYDLEIGIEYVMDCEIAEQGATVVDAKTFIEIIRKLPNNKINIELLEDNNQLLIECEESVYKLSTMNPEEFPELPKIEVEKSIELTDMTFKSMIKKTIFAVSLDETKPIFTGCLIEVLKDKVNLVSIDGFRLAFVTEKIFNVNEPFKAVIPGKTLNEINKILAEDGTKVNIGISKNQAMFEMGDCKLVSRLLEGEFLNYENVIPKDRETRVKINTNTLIQVIERASLVSFSTDEKSKKFPLKLHIEVGKLTITCNGSIGNAKEELYIETEGKELEIGFNHKYLLDALKACDDEEVYIDFGTSVSPCIIRGKDKDVYLYMVLPVRLTD